MTEVVYLTLEAGRQQITSLSLFKTILWCELEGTQYDITYAPSTDTRKAYHIINTGRLRFHATSEVNRQITLLVKS
jgi:hypothetical protein